MTTAFRIDDFPAAFHAADRTSVEGQRRFLRATKLRLVMLAVAAGAGAFTWRTQGGVTDWAGVLAAIAFIAAIAVEAFILQTRPERAWYEGRAAAESMKTLAWRYSVGGEPFALEAVSEADVDGLFVARLREVLGELDELDLPAIAEGRQITDRMCVLRTSPLSERVATYEQGRIADQQRWYVSRAKDHARKARQWTSAMIVFEIGGGTGAVLKATGALDVDVLGLAGTVVASIAAWLQTKQYGSLVGAYSLAAHELGAVRSMLRWQGSEGAWAGFVRDAEEAISREHTLWRASRRLSPSAG